jgi:hypothetical protein
MRSITQGINSDGGIAALMHIFRAQADERADEQSRVNRQENHRKIESSMRLSSC